MGWKVEFIDKALDDLKRLDRKDADRIVVFLQTRIEGAENPRRIGEPLDGSSFRGFWRYRVGDYRVICNIDDQSVKVLVMKIGHRRDVYR